MNPLSRLSQDGADDFEAALLRSARGDGASANRDRTLAALGVAGAALGAAGAGKINAGIPGASKGLGALKWLALVGLGAIGGLAGLAALRHHGVPADDAGRAAIAQPSVGPAGSSPEPTVPVAPAKAPAGIVKQVELIARPTARPARASIERAAPRSPQPSAEQAQPSTAADSLLEEVSILDRSRLQLLRRDGIGARLTAETYLTRFPKGRLATEAEAIRVHATLLTDGPSAAAPLAAAFLRQHPHSPQAPAIRELIQRSLRAPAAVEKP